MVKTTLKEQNKPDPVGTGQTLLPDTDVEDGQQVCHKCSRPWCVCLSVTVTLIVIALVSFLSYIFLVSRGQCGVIEEDDWEDKDAVEIFRELLIPQLDKYVQVLEDDNVELIQVPEFKFATTVPAKIVHDFNKNLTAFLDLTLNKCYVIPLNTSAVLPPRDLQELITNVTAGTYLQHFHLVHEQLVVTGRLDDVEKLGPFISNMCRDYETYGLEHRTSIAGIEKDEILDCRRIRHFENVYVMETQICEL